MSLKTAILISFMTTTLIAPLKAASEPTPADVCRFIGVRDFAGYNTGLSSNASEQVLLSPVYKAPIAWNELIVSWNAEMPAGSTLQVEARAIFPDHVTKYYVMGVWSPDRSQRHSVKHQGDADGRVKDDTLILHRQGGDVQLKLSFLTNGSTPAPKLKFIGLSFCDTHITAPPQPADEKVWGKIVTTTERSQHSYPEESGWCSPTSLSMVLTRWGGILHRPELQADVPEVASNVYDPVFGGTGNWPFNTAYAGSFPGMRAYVTRFSDISELEEWIAAGIPVVISAPWHLLQPGRPDTGSGHLTVCIGFTKDGDVVINDPATNLQKGQKVRHIYKRENVIKSWKETFNTVYLVYPETAQIPADRFGHWEKP